MRYEVRIDGQVFEVRVEPGASQPRVFLDDREVDVDFTRLSGAAWSLISGGRSHVVCVERAGDEYRVEIADASWRVRVRDEREVLADEVAGARAASGEDRRVKALMPGVVTRVVVEPGQAVVDGQALLYVEAMKMENEIKSRAAGKVATVLVKPGDSVAAGQVLVELDPA